MYSCQSEPSRATPNAKHVHDVPRWLPSLQQRHVGNVLLLSNTGVFLSCEIDKFLWGLSTETSHQLSEIDALKHVNVITYKCNWSTRTFHWGYGNWHLLLGNSDRWRFLLVNVRRKVHWRDQRVCTNIIQRWNKTCFFYIGNRTSHHGRRQALSCNRHELWCNRQPLSSVSHWSTWQCTQFLPLACLSDIFSVHSQTKCYHIIGTLRLRQQGPRKTRGWLDYLKD